MFYEQLKKLCEENNKKITPFVKELGISEGSIGNWKKGGTVNSDIIIKIATYFNTTTDYLLLGKEETQLSNAEKRILRLYKKLPPDTKNMVDFALNQVEQQELADNTKIS